MSSAVHQKAVEKQNAVRLREEQMRQSGLSDVQAMALGAAAWANTHGAGSAQAQHAVTSRTGAAPSRAPPTKTAQHQGRTADQSRQGVKRTADSTTHEQMLHMARGDEEEEQGERVKYWRPKVEGRVQMRQSYPDTVHALLLESKCSDLCGHIMDSVCTSKRWLLSCLVVRF